MENIDKIRKMLCKELDKIGEQGALSGGDFEMLYKGLSALKNSYKVEEYEGGGEYSHRRGGRSYADYGYMDDMSMRGYSRGDDYAMRRDSMGRYARDDYGYYSRDDLKQKMRELMDQPGMDRQAKQEMQKILDRLNMQG